MMFFTKVQVKLRYWTITLLQVKPIVLVKVQSILLNSINSIIMILEVIK